MDRLDSLQAFVNVVDSGSFAGAARRMGVSRSAVSKLVARLEGSVGVQLLNRTTRHVAPTEAGAAYYERGVAILAALDEADRAAAGLQSEPRGTIRLNAPMSFGTLHLARALADFMADWPDLRIEATLSDSRVDLVEEGYDLVLRIADLADSSLIARRLAPVRRAICAAPAYLDAFGTPDHPRALRDHRCLQYGHLATGNVWRLRGPDGAHDVHLDGVLCSNNAEMLCAGAVRGLGIALLPTFIAGPELQEGRLTAILADYAAPPIGLYAVYPPTTQVAAKIRLLIEFLRFRFGDDPYWDLVR